MSEPVQGHAGPSRSVHDRNDQPGPVRHDSVIAGQQRVQSWPATIAFGNRDRARGQTLQPAQGPFPLAHHGHGQAACAFGPGHTRHVDDHGPAGVTVLDRVADRTELGHRSRGQRTAAVHSERQVGLPGYHWTSAVSIVEPGPMVISTP